MASADDEYLMRRNKQFHRRVRIMTVISMFGFFGSILVGGMEVIQQAISHPQKQIVSIETSLGEQARGYEQILQQEPNNQQALEKLSLVRLRMKDFKGSVEILEKLTQQHPDRQDYKELLSQMRKQQD